jgi:6-phosphofructokinase 1
VRIERCKNILENEKITQNKINPCFGDPVNRDVLQGGFLGEKAFIKPDSFYMNYETGVGFHRAGPRLHTAFDPTEVKVAIVTCGGLCPGLNVVIRELVMCLWYNYGVRTIFGIRYGYEGFYNENSWIDLKPLFVRDIHTQGGTVLGSSRGGFDKDRIIESIEKRGLNMIFAIGGDGTHRGIASLAEEFEKRNLKIVIAGIPKTIDNDLPIIDRSFGFESAVEQAVKAIQSANIEALSCKKGVGLVKLFGRHCGFIALQAALASRDVNICLIPEAYTFLYGPKGLLNFIMERLRIKGQCIIVVAEGAGSSVMDKEIFDSGKTDKSGNPILPDIGQLLKDEILKFAKEQGQDEVTLKYIDPTYIIRSCPANSFDTNYCSKLAQNAVHSAFSGFTNFTSGFCDNKPVIIPIDFLNTQGQRQIDIETDMDYLSLLASTGQASFSGNIKKKTSACSISTANS